MNYQIDIEELNVEHKYLTHNGAMCLCEFHDDTHPSMFVNTVEQFFYCFACGEHGNIDKLIKATGGTKKWVRYQNVKSKEDTNWRKFLSFPLAYDDDYLMSRRVTNSQVDKFQIRSSEDFIIFDVGSGVKIRIKNPKNKIKYLTFGKMPTVYDSNNSTDTIMIVEGMFGVLHFDRVGVSAMTPLSANRAIGMKKTVEYYDNNFRILFDDDYAGYINALKLMQVCEPFTNISMMNVFCDVDELSDNALFEIANCDSEKFTIDNWVGFIYNMKKKDETLANKLLNDMKKFLN